jgi:hypothetical protein
MFSSGCGLKNCRKTKRWAYQWPRQAFDQDSHSPSSEVHDDWTASGSNGRKPCVILKWNVHYLEAQIRLRSPCGKVPANLSITLSMSRKQPTSLLIAWGIRALLAHITSTTVHDEKTLSYVHSDWMDKKLISWQRGEKLSYLTFWMRRKWLSHLCSWRLQRQQRFFTILERSHFPSNQCKFRSSDPKSDFPTSLYTAKERATGIHWSKMAKLWKDPDSTNLFLEDNADVRGRIQYSVQYRSWEFQEGTLKGR